MEDIDNQGTIDSKYIIVNKKGHGLTSNVYLVKDSSNQMIYAAKVLKKPSKYFQNELNILNFLKEINNPYLIHIIDSGEGIVNRKNKQNKRQYIILDNVPNGELMNYIYYPKKGLREKLSKLIFAQILEGVQACHNAGFCHRDIKMENILLDENFSPKIIDFGFATLNNDHLNEPLGTENYAAPEIFRNKPYNGFKADIFSLGVVLFTLTSAKLGFGTATRNDYYYKYIIKNDINNYWKELEKKIPTVSKELKELYIKMVSYNPNKRPTIKEIFDSDWMKEIKNMSKEQLEELEKELKEELLSRKPLVESGLKKEAEVKQESDELSGNKGANDVEDYFDLNLKPNYAHTGLNMNHYIKLKGNLIHYKFMNNLINMIKNEFKDDIHIVIDNKNKAKFEAIFNENKNEDDNNEELEEEINEELKKNIKGGKTVIQFKLYESYNGGFILRFVKKEGEINNYLDKLETIYSLISKI